MQKMKFLYFCCVHKSGYCLQQCPTNGSSSLLSRQLHMKAHLIIANAADMHVAGRLANRINSFYSLSSNIQTLFIDLLYVRLTICDV